MSVLRAISSFAVAAALIFGWAILPARADDNLLAILAGNSSVSSNVLASQRGAGLNPDALAIANVSHNSVGDNTVTGDNKVINAFDSSTGVFTVLQNSGNNVAMQSQTIVNVNLQ